MLDRGCLHFELSQPPNSSQICMELCRLPPCRSFTPHLPRLRGFRAHHTLQKLEPCLSVSWTGSQTMIGPESGCYPCSRISKLAGGANRAFSRWSRLQSWHSIVQAYPTDQGHLPESTHWQSPGDLLAGRHQLRDAGAACLRPRECPGIHVGRAPSLVGCDPLAEMWSISKLSVPGR